MANPQIIYCHCSHAQVVPADVKEAVLRKLCEANISFEAVADLCESSARRDAVMRRIASQGPVKIAACFPRAVKWLFAAADASLKVDAAEIVNMRVDNADAVVQRLLDCQLQPNVPENAAPPSKS